jgi:RimJ/RimL family protein N-acetyltransferase
LRLRPLDEDDADLLLPICLEPEVTRYFSNKVTDLAGVRRLVLDRLTRDIPPGMGSWVLQRDDTVVGIAHLWLAKDPAGVAEIGWLLGREYWGVGLAGEAAAAVIEHGFRRLGLPMMLALVHRGNDASLRLAKRLGFLDFGEEEHHDEPHRVLVLLPDQVGSLHHIELRVTDVSAAEASLGWLLPALGWISETRWSDGLSWRHGQLSVVVRTAQDEVEALFEGDVSDVVAESAADDGGGGVGEADDAADDGAGGADEAAAAYLYDTSGVEQIQPGPVDGSGADTGSAGQVGRSGHGQLGRTSLALSAGSAVRVAELTTAAVERDWQLLSIDRYADTDAAGRQVVYLRTPDGIDIELVGDGAQGEVFEGFGPGSA